VPEPSHRRFSLGIDIGGTFTDIVVYDHAQGRRFSRKVLTTHDDPSRGVVEGIDRVLAEDGVPAAEIGRVVHATTLFTNAMIERKGAVTGLVTTAGFRDALEIGRERKYELYDVHIEKPQPLVPRHLRAEVPERMDARGAVRIPLDEAALETVVDGLVRDGVTSVAVAFLHAYANPAHERAAAAVIARRFPDLAVSTSSDVAPEIREYERTSTTVANAYIKPLARTYLDAIAAQLARRGIAAPLLLMISNGGLTHVEEAKRVPVQLLESGPAAGALAAAWLGTEDAGGDVLAFDMGGTTAKLSVVDGGKPLVAYHFEAARQKRFAAGSGLPIRISTIELIEIGAGGGSIAHLDAIGLLKVGPESAGSEPGPAAYGLGGAKPTVTDADFLLGYLNPDFFAGGSMAIDMAAARAAMAEVANEADLSAGQLAWGIHDVVNENMASAARVHIAERGKDPRRYALLCTGGGGPLHAYYVAKKLNLKRIVCPSSAGVASAMGLLIAPAKVDRVATVAQRLDALDWAEFEATFGRLEADARRIVGETGLDPATARIERIADVRYVGQAFEVVVDLPPGPYDACSLPALMVAFETAYVEKFTRTPPAVFVEIINVRVSVAAPVPGGELAIRAEAKTAAEPIKGYRRMYFPEWGEHREAPVFDRYAIAAGDSFEGPGVVEERESTLVIGPGATFRVSETGNLVVDLP
jgi:N-methylhydantoinase A